MGHEEITRKIRKYFKMKKEYTYQNSWDATKLVLRGNFIAVNQYIKNDLKFKTNKKKSLYIIARYQVIQLLE